MQKKVKMRLVNFVKLREGQSVVDEKGQTLSDRVTEALDVSGKF